MNSFHATSSSEPESNRLLLVRVWYCSNSLLWNKFGFGLVRLYLEEHGSGSILFEFIFMKANWNSVRFQAPNVIYITIRTYKNSILHIFKMNFNYL